MYDLMAAAAARGHERRLAVAEQPQPTFAAAARSPWRSRRPWSRVRWAISSARSAARLAGAVAVNQPLAIRTGMQQGRGVTPAGEAALSLGPFLAPAAARPGINNMYNSNKRHKEKLYRRHCVPGSINEQ